MIGPSPVAAQPTLQVTTSENQPPPEQTTPDVSSLLKVTSEDESAAATFGPPTPSFESLRAADAAWCEARGPAVTNELLRHHHTLTSHQAMRAARALCHEAERSHLDPLLLLAVIGVESSFNPQAISPVGAEGLMQLMPHTGKYLAARVNLAWSQRVAFDPAINIRIGARYLATLRDAFHGRMDWALTAYNRGPSATHHLLRQHHGLPHEVRAAYASRVLSSYEKLKRSYKRANSI